MDFFFKCGSFFILFKRLLLFPPYPFLVRLIFFLSKMPLRFSDFKIRTEFFLCYGMKKKWVFHPFGFYNPKASKNRARYMNFSDYRIRTTPKHHFSRKKQLGLYNSNWISTNCEHVCNLDSHFKDNNNLPNSHG